MNTIKSRAYYCSWGHALHFALCAICHFLVTSGHLGILWVQALVFGIDMLVWCFIGLVSCLGHREQSSGKKASGGFLLSLYALTPVLVLYTAMLLIQKAGYQPNSGWALFYFLAAPLQFWCRPASLLVRTFSALNGYYLYGFYFAIILLSINAGHLYALGLKRTRKKSQRLVRSKSSERKEASA